MKPSHSTITGALASALAVAMASAAQAQTETLTATFTRADGGVTVNSYDDDVLLDVTGTGQSQGTNYNDAFYVYTIGMPTHDPLKFQMTYSPHTLVASDPSQDAVNYVVGGLPAYEPSHDYTFLLNTGLSTPGQLHFGVSDGDFADNTGAYTITVTEVPEPGAYAILASLGLSGAAFLRRRRAG